MTFTEMPSESTMYYKLNFVTVKFTAQIDYFIVRVANLSLYESQIS